MTELELIVYAAALESVASFENSIRDGETVPAFPSRHKVMNYARRDVMDECPRYVRLALGPQRITDLCFKAADEFEFRTW